MSEEPLLTDLERQLIQDLGRISTQITEQVVGWTPTRDDDIREIESHIHVLQRMLMAQAAVRAFPGEFRPLGGMVEIKQSE